VINQQIVVIFLRLVFSFYFAILNEQNHTSTVNHGHDDIQPYRNAKSLILCLYNSLMAQVSK